MPKVKKSKIIGLERKKVKLSQYNPRWQKLFEAEKKHLYSAIGRYALDIQHVGSTAIPGMRAKPIIDIAVGLRLLKTGEKCVKPLEKLGYEYKHTAGVKGRRFFAKGSEKNRTHYLHLEKLNGKLWQNHILFKDYLLTHEDAVKRYNRLKGELARKYKDDRDSYTAKKDIFINEILEKARQSLKK